MIEKIIDKIISKQFNENTISKDEVNIYKYGYMLVFEMFINVILAIIIGIVSKKFVYVLIFLLLYIPLRSFCGGWHADKLWKCTIYSNVILIILVIVIDWIVCYCPSRILLIGYGICSSLVFIMSPVDTKTKPIDEDEKKTYKRKINIIQIVHIILLIFMQIYNIKEIVFVLTFVYVIQTVLLLFGNISNHEKV